MSNIPRIKISDILNYLKEGYTRTKTDKNYDPEIGSIQEKYNLNKTQTFELFQHERLKGKKTIVKRAPAFIIVDDTDAETENTEEVSSPDTPTLTDINDSSTTEDNSDVVEPTPSVSTVVEAEDDDSWLG